MIRNASDQDFEGLAELYTSFFKVHNIFQKSKNEIIDYLKKKAEKEELIIFEHEGVLGALFLTKMDESEEHSLWKFTHFAFKSEGVAVQLLKEAKERVRKASKSVKIELHIADSEKGRDFYLNNGYGVEGKLNNHYRVDETTYILGKTL